MYGEALQVSPDVYAGSCHLRVKYSLARAVPGPPQRTGLGRGCLGQSRRDACLGQ